MHGTCLCEIWRWKLSLSEGEEARIVGWSKDFRQRGWCRTSWWNLRCHCHWTVREETENGKDRWWGTFKELFDKGAKEIVIEAAKVLGRSRNSSWIFSIAWIDYLFLCQLVNSSKRAMISAIWFIPKLLYYAAHTQWFWKHMAGYGMSASVLRP